MGKWAYVKAVMGLCAIVFVGVGTFVVLSQLSREAVTYLVGGLFVLVVVVVVGALLVGKDLVQAYILRRTVAEDDLSDLRQMAMTMALMRQGGGSNVNVKIPEMGQGQASPFQQYLLPGSWGQEAGPRGRGVQEQAAFEYEDATIELE